MLAQTPVIPLVEREEDWERLRCGLFAYWAPEGMMEEVLVERIATIIWRQWRVVRFERESIQGYLEEVPRDWRAMRRASGLPAPGEVTPEAVAEMDRMLSGRLLPGDETLEKVMRYETKMHRFLLQTIHQLLLLKGLRKYLSGRYYGLADLEIERPAPVMRARVRVDRRNKVDGGTGRKDGRGSGDEGTAEG